MSKNGENTLSSSQSSDFEKGTQNIFRADGKVEKHEMEAISKMYASNKERLRRETQGNLRDFINTDYRIENEKILGGPKGVENLQKYLNRGRPLNQKLEVDSRFGPETFFALIEYQYTYDFPATGIVSNFLKSSVEVFAQETSKSPFQLQPSLKPSDTKLSRDFSSKIGLRVNGTKSEIHIDEFKSELEQFVSTELSKKSKKLEKFQREMLSLEGQLSSLQSFLEQEVGVVESIGDSISKISKPFTGKKLYETGEDIIDAQIAKIQASAVSLQMRLISDFTTSKTLSPEQDVIVADIFERISKVSQFKKQDKSWSDLTLTSLGGKNVPVVVFLHRFIASIPEGAYKTVEGAYKTVEWGIEVIAKTGALLAAYGLEPALRKEIEEDLLQIVRSLNYEAIPAFVGKIPEFIAAFLALPADKQAQGFGRFIGGILVPVGAGAAIVGRGKAVVQEGKTLVGSGIKEMKNAIKPGQKPVATPVEKPITVADDFVDTISSHDGSGAFQSRSGGATVDTSKVAQTEMTTNTGTSAASSTKDVVSPTQSVASTPSVQPAPTIVQPTSPVQPATLSTPPVGDRVTQFAQGAAETIVGGAQIVGGSAAVGTGIAVRAVEFDFKGSPKPPVSAGKNPHLVERIPKEPVNGHTKESVPQPKPVEMLTDTEQILKDIRLLRKYFHADANEYATNTGEIMRRIDELKTNYDKEISKLKQMYPGKSVGDLPLSTELRRIQKEVKDIHTNKEQILHKPQESSPRLREALFSDVQSKGRDIRKIYAPELFAPGTSEYFRCKKIAEITELLEESVPSGMLTPKEALEHLEELRISPETYMQREHGLSLEASVQSERQKFKREQKTGPYESNQIKQSFALESIGGEFNRLKNSLQKARERAQNSGNIARADWYNETIHQLNTAFNGYQTVPGLASKRLEEALTDFMYHIRNSPDMLVERKEFLSVAGKISHVIEERGTIEARSVFKNRTLFHSVNPFEYPVGKKFVSESAIGRFEGFREIDGIMTGTMVMKDGTKMMGKNGTTHGRFSKEGHFLSGELQLNTGAKLEYDFYRDPAFILQRPSRQKPFQYPERLFGDIIALKDIYRRYASTDIRTILEAHLYAPALLKRKGLLQEDIIFLLEKIDTIEREVQAGLRKNEPLEEIFKRLQEKNDH